MTCANPACCWLAIAREHATQRDHATRHMMKARAVIAGVEAALGSRCTGDLPADVARVVGHLATVCRAMPQVSPDDPQTWDRSFREALGVVVQQARSDERSKIAERLRERATSEQITADRWAASNVEGSGALLLRHEAVARVLREMASSLTSPEELNDGR